MKIKFDKTTTKEQLLEYFTHQGFYLPKNSMKHLVRHVPLEQAIAEARAEGLVSYREFKARVKKQAELDIQERVNQILEAQEYEV